MASHSLISKSFKTVKHSKEKTQKKFSDASDGKYCMNIEMGKQDTLYGIFMFHHVYFCRSEKKYSDESKANV